MTSASLQLMAAFGDWSSKPSLYEVEAEATAASYRVFLRAAWHVIEPSTPLVDGWYIDALADHCEAWVRGEIPALMIHIRPRAGKTNIVSVILGGWIWTHSPGARLLWGSYSLERRDEDSRRTRVLVTSDWYQQRWRRPLADDQQVKHRFALADGGYRFSAIYGSGATGDGGDYVGLDDPQSVTDQYSPTELKRDHEWYYHGWQSRRNQGEATPELIVCQRLGVNDLCGRLRADDPQRWQVLGLQTRRTVLQSATYWKGSESLVLPLIDTALSRDGRFVDPREPGDLLSPRDSASELAAMERAQPTLFAAQQQQAPAKATNEGAKFRNFNRAVHLRSFAEKMGQPDLLSAISEALRRGWEVGVGIDHGLDGGREVAYISLAHQKLQEVWTVGSYRNAKRTTPLEDAMGIRAELDRLGIPIRRVVRARGDVGNLGKGSAGGAAGSINAALTAAVYPKGHPKAGLPVLGFSVVTAVKRSVEEDVENVNIALASGGVFIDESQEVLAVALENWSEGEAYKDDCDAWRYDVSPIVRPWLISGRTA